MRPLTEALLENGKLEHQTIKPQEANLEALSLKGKPQLQLVGRERDVELGGVMGGGGIEADGSSSAQECAVPIAHGQLPSLPHEAGKALGCRGGAGSIAAWLGLLQLIEGCTEIAESSLRVMCMTDKRAAQK